MPGMRATNPVGAAILFLAIAACSESTTAAPGPPASMRDLHAEVSGRTVALSWLDSDAGGTNALIARFSLMDGVDARPEPGVAYREGDGLGSGEVVFAGPGTSMIDTPPCRDHIYAGWIGDAGHHWSTGAATREVTGLPGAELSGLEGLAADIQNGTVVFEWQAPGDSHDTYVKIERREGPSAIGLDDADAVFFGRASAGRAVDPAPALMPGAETNYAVLRCTPCGECVEEDTRIGVTPTLMQALGAGGFVIYWRHATATVCDDRLDLGTTLGWWKSCERDCKAGFARQLSDEGYAEAEEIGQVLRERRVPFGRVISSEFCRCTETAEHMALGPDIETAAGLTFFVHDEPSRCSAVEALLAHVPEAGTNTALIGHINFPEPRCPDIADLESGEAAIYRPDGKGGSVLVGRVRADEWSGMD